MGPSLGFFSGVLVGCFAGPAGSLLFCSVVAVGGVGGGSVYVRVLDGGGGGYRLVSLLGGVWLRLVVVDLPRVGRGGPSRLGWIAISACWVGAWYCSCCVGGCVLFLWVSVLWYRLFGLHCGSVHDASDNWALHVVDLVPLLVRHDAQVVRLWLVVLRLVGEEGHGHRSFAVLIPED